jgi:hypothetical protein
MNNKIANLYVIKRRAFMDNFKNLKGISLSLLSLIQSYSNDIGKIFIELFSSEDKEFLAKIELYGWKYYTCNEKMNDKLRSLIDEVSKLV